jgi:fused signal recognition particle receptor
MFGILKKKFSQLVEAISKKTEEKKKVAEEPEKKKIAELPKEAEGKIGEPAEKVTEIIEEKIPEPQLEVKEQIEEKAIEPPRKEDFAKPEKKKSWLGKIKEKFVKTVFEKKLTEEDMEPILNELETGLIEADVALEVAEKIKNDLKTGLVGKEIKRGKEKEIVLESLKQSLLGILSVPRIDLEEVIRKSKSENRPALFLFFGINGVGKSLNLSKVAKYLKEKGHQPILAAGDTFRAAGDEQLEIYANTIDVPVVRQQRGADSCAVIFDARKSAEAKGDDVVLGDTSGRMHTKKDLLDELVKIVKVNKPDLKILVLDSLSGSDVVQQFEFFDKAVGIDATIFSKIDVNEKGGNILSVCHNFKKPILFLGTGQSFEDLIEFVPDKFVNTLVGM